MSGGRVQDRWREGTETWAQWSCWGTSLTSLWLLLCQPRSPKTCVPCVMPSNVSDCLWNENQEYRYAHTALQWCLDFNFKEYYKLNIENLCILFLNLLCFWHNSKQYSPKQAWDLVNIRNLPKPPGGPRYGLFFIFYKLFLLKSPMKITHFCFYHPVWTNNYWLSCWHLNLVLDQ